MIRNITGADFKAFYQDQAVWTYEGNSDAFFCEDIVFTIQGQENLDMDGIYNRYGEDFEHLPDDAKINFECGYRLPHHTTKISEGNAPEEDMLVLFKEWQTNRTDVTFLAKIAVPKTDLDGLARVEKALAELADLGVTVTRSDQKPEEAAPARAPKP